MSALHSWTMWFFIALFFFLPIHHTGISRALCLSYEDEALSLGFLFLIFAVPNVIMKLQVLQVQFFKIPKSHFVCGFA